MLGTIDPATARRASSVCAAASSSAVRLSITSGGLAGGSGLWNERAYLLSKSAGDTVLTSFASHGWESLVS